MIHSAGVAIYPSEVEAAILSQDGVRDCAVFGLSDAVLGETVCACVEPLPGHVIAPDALRSALEHVLDAAKRPRRIEVMANLPREDSGKIFKQVLRDRVRNAT